MTDRYDSSAVPLQGAYVAKQCPVRAQNDLLMPGILVEAGAFQQRLFDRGNAFEASVVAALVAAEPAAAVIEGGGLVAEAATLAAMEDGAPLILNGRLSDEVDRRVGKPDLLVSAADRGYRAVDIKWHMALDVLKSPGKSATALVSPLSAVRREAAVEETAYTARRLQEDLLQLAHYQRILERAGFAAGDGRFAGIIGTERRVVWYDLDAAMWRTHRPSRRPPSSGAPWSDTTSSSIFGSTSLPWRSSPSSIPPSSYLWFP